MDDGSRVHRRTVNLNAFPIALEMGRSEQAGAESGSRQDPGGERRDRSLALASRDMDGGKPPFGVVERLEKPLHHLEARLRAEPTELVEVGE